MNLRHDMIECFVVRPTATSHEFLQILRSPGRYMAGVWHTVAGRIEAGETAVAAAVREMREETSLVPLELYCLDRIGSFYIPEQDTLWHSVIFCAIVPADAPVQLNEEHDAFRWMARDTAAAHFVWPGNRESIAQVCTEILDGSAAKPRMRVPLG